MFLCNTQGNSEKEEYYFKIASQNKVDGSICVSYRDKESYISEDIPIISLDRHFEKKISCICIQKTTYTKISRNTYNSFPESTNPACKHPDNMITST